MDHWADYLIFVVFTTVSIAIGFYHALTKGKQRTPEEFIMADRKMQLLPTTLSLLMSYNSAILILGSPAEIYSYGSEILGMAVVGFGLSLVLTERICVPWLYPLRLTSVNEYFEMRYGNREIRALASIVGIISAILYMGIATYAPAIALKSATGFPVMVSIPLMSVICVIYTAAGGMRAVIWTDVFQFVIMLIGLAVIFIKGLINVGAKEAFDVLAENDRQPTVTLSLDPRVRQTLWAYMIGWSLQWACIFGLQQASVQRYSSLPTIRKARLCALLTAPSVCLLNVLTYSTGIIVFSYYAKQHCDPIVSGEISGPNELLPLFVRQMFTKAHGFSGLFLSTLFSGALSSVSSSLSGSAANAWDDIIKFHIPPVSEYKAALINKALVVAIGILSTGTAFCAALMTGPVTQIGAALFGACGGPLLGLFFLSGTHALRWVRSRGVLIAGILGLGTNMWLCVSAGFVKNKYEVKPPITMENCSSFSVSAWNITNSTAYEEYSESNKLEGIEQFYSMSFIWYSLFGACVTTLIGLVTSALMNVMIPAKRAQIDKKLFASYRGMFRCGLDASGRSVEPMSDATKSQMEFLTKDETTHI